MSDQSMSIISVGQRNDAIIYIYIYLATPFSTSTPSEKFALTAKAIDTYSGRELHMCINDTIDKNAIEFCYY